MTTINLDRLFRPRSIAVLGASDREFSVGATVLKNVIAGGFVGRIMPVNPRHAVLAGLPTYADVASLPETPDLAIIGTPPATVPGLIDDLGRRGTKAAIVITSGLGAVAAVGGGTLRQAMLAAARPHMLRLLGPNCVGMLVPGIGLNASFAHTDALPGNIAFVSQSGALVTAVLDWAKTRQIGFSKFVSLGDAADIDFGDLLEYLASDPDTRSILLYIESIRAASKFMAAARGAARAKLVLVVKAGRVKEGAKAAASHTGALAGTDDVYDAAIRRAGMLRVYSTEELFDAVETLGRSRPLVGERLAIMTNGGGPGVMATDALILQGGTLATLGEATMAKLDAVLPSTWSRGNPVDIGGDAPVERYVQTLNILQEDSGSDAILFMHAPTAIVPSNDIATAVAPLAKNAQRNVLASWIGGDTLQRARQTFGRAGIPTYNTPEEAVRSFLQLVQYRRNQQLLLEQPLPRSAGDGYDRARAAAIVNGALAEGRTMLSEPEAKDVLVAYGVPVVDTRVARTIAEAVAAASVIGFPVALKILSPQISHKSDVGGVALDLNDAKAVETAARAMLMRVDQVRPGTPVTGFTVQSMVRRPNARELIAGITTDPIFGPIILFGQGGIAVEVIADRAVGLPPLNAILAHDMIARTHVAKLLDGYRGRPPADIGAVAQTLVTLADLVTDVPEIAELDINPLLADDQGVIALDARVVVSPVAPPRADHLPSRRPTTCSA